MTDLLQSSTVTEHHRPQASDSRQATGHSGSPRAQERHSAPRSKTTGTADLARTAWWINQTAHRDREWIYLNAGAYRCVWLHQPTQVVYKLPLDDNEHAAAASYCEHDAVRRAQQDDTLAPFIPDINLFVVNDLPIVAMEYIPIHFTWAELDPHLPYLKTVLRCYVGFDRDVRPANVRHRGDGVPVIIDWGGIHRSDSTSSRSSSDNDYQHHNSDSH